MAVYNPSGSGGVHMDKAISGKKKAPAKKAAPADPNAPKKAAPGKKALPPFMQPGKKKGGK